MTKEEVERLVELQQARRDERNAISALVNRMIIGVGDAQVRCRKVRGNDATLLAVVAAAIDAREDDEPAIPHPDEIMS